MTEEIKTQQTTAAASPSTSVEETTVGARMGAERENGDGKAGNRKPPVSWAALLEEAVTKPGFIHEAYSRFHGFSIGNQILALDD